MTPSELSESCARHIVSAASLFAPKAEKAASLFGKKAPKEEKDAKRLDFVEGSL